MCMNNSSLLKMIYDFACGYVVVLCICQLLYKIVSLIILQMALLHRY